MSSRAWTCLDAMVKHQTCMHACAAHVGAGREPAPSTSTPHGSLSSRLWFGWVSPLMATGAARQLQPDDLLLLDSELQPRACSEALWQCWSQVRNQGGGCPLQAVTVCIRDDECRMQCRGGRARGHVLKAGAVSTSRAQSLSARFHTPLVSPLHKHASWYSPASIRPAQYSIKSRRSPGVQSYG